MVSHICYVFQSANLLGDTAEIYLYDEFASIGRYVELCQKKLSQVYPDAIIEVYTKDQIWKEEEDVPIETTVDGDSSDTETAPVNHICTEVYNTFEWLVPKPWLNLSQAANRLQLPIPILRWLCKEGHIETAKNFEGTWKIPIATFPSSANGLVFRWLDASKVTDCSGICFCGYEDIGLIKVSDCLSMNKMLVSAQDGFGIPLFNGTSSSLAISFAETQVELIFEHFADKVPWTLGDWSYDAYTQALMMQARQHKDISVARTESQYMDKIHAEGIQFRFNSRYQPQDILEDIVEQTKEILRTIIQDAEVTLRNGPSWKSEYERQGNETLFCQEVLEHLLHKMGFEGVRYIHGNDEYGRDFILAEQTRWGWVQYYGIQVKAGDVSGGARSDIDKILGQIEDALTMPYRGQNAEEIFITSFIVAISGHFKKNAKEKITEKIPRRDWRGSVRFLDQDDIRALIRKHWLQISQHGKEVF